MKDLSPYAELVNYAYYIPYVQSLMYIIYFLSMQSAIWPQGLLVYRRIYKIMCSLKKLVNMRLINLTVYNIILYKLIN